MIEYHDYHSDSYELDEEQHELASDDDDPVVRRLRAMRWAQIPDDIRERCWEDIRRRLDEREGAAGDRRQRPARDVNGDRYAFSRRREPVHSFTPRRLVAAQPRHSRSLTPAWSFR
jgi:hypothetical protein